jgi:hypothetical protein
MVPNGWIQGYIKDLLFRLESGNSVNGEERALKKGEKDVLKVSSVLFLTENLILWQ